MIKRKGRDPLDSGGVGFLRAHLSTSYPTLSEHWLDLFSVVILVVNFSPPTFLSVGYVVSTDSPTFLTFKLQYQFEYFLH